MEKVIEVVGNISGVMGVLACFVSGLFRLVGQYTLFDKILIESVFILGIGLMVLACLAKLHLLSSRK